MSDRHQWQQGFHHLRADTIHGIEVFYRRKRTMLLPPFHDAFGQDRTNLRQGIEFFSRRGVEIDLASGNVPGSGSASGPASARNSSSRWRRNDFPGSRNMDFRGVLHHRCKVEAIQLGSRLRSSGGGDRIKYPRSGGQSHDPGILHGTHNMDRELAALGFRRRV